MNLNDEFFQQGSCSTTNSRACTYLFIKPPNINHASISSLVADGGMFVGTSNCNDMQSFTENPSMGGSFISLARMAVMTTLFCSPHVPPTVHFCLNAMFGCIL